ncbi:MAG: DUF6485 family protein [Candidatus Gygaella obscura]|nr:DUF6485 family protein [Candidatus Gygaella obscura]
MSECKIAQNQKYCNCTYDSCGKKGICCDCLHYHRKMGQLPACYFPDDIEKTYDRSIEKFIEVYKQRGSWW